jgi:hypothetical protein
LVVRAREVPRLEADLALQTLWVSLQRRSWKSLAVLAASAGVETLGVANTLARMGWSYTGRPSCVLDLRDLGPRLMDHQIQSMAAQLEEGERVFVALKSPAENPTASPIAMAADAIVLCVELGRTDMKTAQQTVAAIGHERFVGTILIEPTDSATLHAATGLPR